MTLTRRALPLLALGLGLVSAPLAAQELGDASVLSQRGQKLKIAVPYGSAPNQRVPVTRFMVESVTVPEGFKAPAASSFVISKPERRNVIYLQSREIVEAPSAHLVLKVALSETPRIAYDVAIPAAAYAPTASDGADTAKPAVATKRSRPMRRKSLPKRPAVAPAGATPPAIVVPGETGKS